MRHGGKCRLIVMVVAAVLAACSGGVGVKSVPDSAVEAAADHRADRGSHVEEGQPEQVDIPYRDGRADWNAETAGPQCRPGEGCFLDKCGSNGDCLSGWCVQHLGEKVCTEPCVGECPPGWTCQDLSGGVDKVWVCLSAAPSLCLPCVDSKACDGGKCIRYGDEAGAFCGANCDETGPCPSGYECKAVNTVEGAQASQCVLTAGECTCTAHAIAGLLETACYRSNEWGKCGGIRLCGQEGLSDCSAPLPSSEVCDGIDNDCDGAVDEELGTTTCGVGACTVTEDNCVEAQVQECVPGTPVAETCDGVDNDCDGNVDEEAPCPQGESCLAGTCQVWCGDGVCGGSETQCTCPADCGTCSGCCTGSTCNPGTSNSACGKDGEACTACSGYCQSCQSKACALETQTTPTWCDPTSGLTWQNPPLDGWKKLAAAESYCSSLSLDGGGWHVPTIMELRSLIRGCPATMTGGSCNIQEGVCLKWSCRDSSCNGCDYNKGPANGYYWPNEMQGKSSCYYWSSSPALDETTSRWNVHFGAGAVSSTDVEQIFVYVRCVH